MPLYQISELCLRRFGLLQIAPAQTLAQTLAQHEERAQRRHRQPQRLKLQGRSNHSKPRLSKMIVCGQCVRQPHVAHHRERDAISQSPVFIHARGKQINGSVNQRRIDWRNHQAWVVAQ